MKHLFSLPLSIPSPVTQTVPIMYLHMGSSVLVTIVRHIGCFKFWAGFVWKERKEKNVYYVRNFFNFSSVLEFRWPCRFSFCKYWKIRPAGFHSAYNERSDPFLHGSQTWPCTKRLSWNVDYFSKLYNLKGAKRKTCCDCNLTVLQ